MASNSLLRMAVRGSTAILRAAPVRAAQQPLMARPATVALRAANSFSTSIPRRGEHQEETFEEFTAR